MEVAEQFADGKATNEDLLRAGCLAAAVGITAIADASLMAAVRVTEESAEQSAWAAEAEDATQADLLRDLFNPWAPALVPSVLAWNGGTVVKLARVIYDGKRFEDLPVLADALEEAGAPQEVVLHCRNGKAHVRGCWALDWVLGAT